MTDMNNERALDVVGRRVKELIARAENDRREAGRLLCEVKESLVHGEWLPWLEQHGIGKRTASRLMLEYRDPEATDRRREANRQKGHVANSEWLRPSKYIALACEAMGGVDCMSYDGTNRAWCGRVWLPLLKQSKFITPIIEALLSDLNMGNVEQAVVLTHNFTDAAWWHSLAENCTLLCFTRGRLTFQHTNGRVGPSANGQFFFYFGDRAEAFKVAFAEERHLLHP